jgi:PAS domain S-box-containing protein
MPGIKKSLSGVNEVVKNPYARYILPVLLVIAATFIKQGFTAHIGYRTPFLLYFGVIIITSRYFGKQPAIMAIILSAMAANFWFLPPYGSISFDKDSFFQLCLFAGECALIIGLSTRLSKAQTIIHEKDTRFKILVEKSSEGIITINAGGKITYCSPSVQNIIGYTDEEFINLPAWALLNPDEALEVKEQFYRFAAHPRDTFSITHQMNHKNGSWVWIESKMTNLLDERPINAIIANFTDVTDRIINEKSREDFISIASHELKTPLTSLKAYTQVLQGRFKKAGDETSLNIINKIEAQVARVIQMVTNLLDVTSLQQKKLSLNIRLFDLNALVTEVVESVQQTTKTHEIVVNLQPAPHISGDWERLAQVISNMITNAIKYSPNASAIQVCTETDGKQVKLTVTDQGIGIPKQDIERVFVRFYRVDNARSNFQGLGLGLYICSQIIEHHGGSIGVTSEVGKGSAFWFSLPLMG